MGFMDYEACAGCEEVFPDKSRSSYFDSSFFYTLKEAEDWVKEQFEQFESSGFVGLWANIYYRGLIVKTLGA